MHTYYLTGYDRDSYPQIRLITSIMFAASYDKDGGLRAFRFPITVHVSSLIQV